MASLFTEDFEGGTNGAAQTTGNTAYTSFSPTKPVFDNTRSISGALSGYIDTTGGAAILCSLYTDGSLHSILFRRVYLYLDSLSGTQQLLVVKSGTTQRAEFRYNVNSGGSFQMRNATTAIWTSTHDPVAGQWYRVEWRVDNTASQQQCRLFWGANLHGTTPDEDSGNQTYNQGTMNRIVTGSEASNSVQKMWWDGEAVDDATWIGPLNLGTDWTQGATDVMGAVDSAARVVDFSTGSTDSINPTDTATTLAVLARTVTDVTGIVDTPTTAAALTRSAGTDAAAFTDTSARVGEFVRSTTDAIGLSDNAGGGSDFTLSLSDNVVPRDSMGRVSGVGQGATDSTGLTDAASRVVGFAKVITDAAAHTDATTRVSGGANNFQVFPLDSMGETDGTPHPTISGVGTDPVGLADTVTTAKGSLTFTDSTGVTDGSGLMVLDGVGTDPVLLTDTITTAKATTTTINVNPVESMGITEPDSGLINYSVDQAETAINSDVEQVAFVPGPNPPDNVMGLADLVTVSHGINTGFNLLEDVDEPLILTDTVAFQHVVTTAFTKVVTDSITPTSGADLVGTEGETSRFYSTGDLLFVVDQTAIDLTAAPVLPGVPVRLVLNRAIRGPRVDDWFWRHHVWLPQPTQVALLVYPDGTVLETDDLMSDQARSAPFVAGGGHQTILDPDSWQAQVLIAAGYEMEPVT